MGIKRVVDISFWNDSKVIDLFSAEDRYFMLYILTNPYTTQLGIYELNKRKAAFEMGYSVESVSVLIERFETKYDVIRYSKETNEIAIKNFLRHSIIKGGKPVEDLLEKEIAKVKDKSLLTFIFSNLKKHENLNDTVKKIIKENDINNDNDNDNENEVSYHDSYHDSSKCSDDTDLKEKKHKYGEYSHVLLKDRELEKLNEDYGEMATQEAITFLDEYIEMMGKKYKSHYLVMKRWVFEAVEERKKKGGASVGGNGTNTAKSAEQLHAEELQRKYSEKMRESGELGKEIELPF